MNKAPAKVIIIPAKPELAEKKSAHRQERVAAYCRVSTDDEEQITSYKAQKEYYTDKIMSKKEWTMAGIYADEGITGTSAKKRSEFLKMIRHCKQHRIDIILTKSISRFARNTVDCLKYTRLLRGLGIAVIFEEQNINSLQPDSEFQITIHGAIAQNESEVIGKNVAWGKRAAMKNGRASFQYKYFYGYEKGEDGEPRIIPEQGEVVRRIYQEFLAGASLRMIKAGLERDGIPDKQGILEWDVMGIRRILTNEKYCGDVLLQKTFIEDTISKKVVKNTGQLNQYLVQDHHEGIVDRQTFDRVQAEFARRNAAQSPSKKYASTGMASYASKYALSERLVCGECGTLYRRVTWSNPKRIVWRCVSRLDYGKKYCKHSPTLYESELQETILAALNRAMSEKDQLLQRVETAMMDELSPVTGQSMSLADIERRITQINEETGAILKKASRGEGYDRYMTTLKAMTEEMAALKEKRAFIQEQQASNQAITSRIDTAMDILGKAPDSILGWDERLIRQLVDMVKVISKDKIEVYLRGGAMIEQEIQRKGKGRNV